MPRLLIYEECLAAGSAGPLGAVLNAELLSEGQAMAFAIAEDCSRVSGWHAHVARAVEFHNHCPSQVPWCWEDCTPAFFSDAGNMALNEWLSHAAGRYDLTLVIAPECQGILEQRARAVLAGGGRLVGSHPDWIALASDKTATLRHLARAGVPVPRGIQGTPTELQSWSGPFPVVLKPNDGVGAWGVCRFVDQASLRVKLEALAVLEPASTIWRCEEFLLGQAASVAALGPSNDDLLLPAKQLVVFDDYGKAEYKGGSFTLRKNQQERALKLGAAVCRAMPGRRGYIGIDMVLGNAVDGSQDAVLEINPRLTTSYLGLRVLSKYPLARLMLKSRSISARHISWSADELEFTKQGQVLLRERS